MVVTSEDLKRAARRREIAQQYLVAVTFSALVALTAASAAYVKRAGSAVPLVALDTLRTVAEDDRASEALLGMAEEPLVEAAEPEAAPAPEPVAAPAPALVKRADPNLRWFNGRPIRPARTMTMVVTGYSPDARSCAGSDDGLTATLHSVETNGFKLVAADTRLLPFGSMVSVPGYDAGQVVPVLDRGGAIKGHRLDLLFPTHEQARAWGVKRLKVVVWEYADGKPATDPRSQR
jgi:3D (Asp-Asp-Asp) domain-containing protein